MALVLRCADNYVLACVDQCEYTSRDFRFNEGGMDVVTNEWMEQVRIVLNILIRLVDYFQNRHGSSLLHFINGSHSK